MSGVAVDPGASGLVWRACVDHPCARACNAYHAARLRDERGRVARADLAEVVRAPYDAVRAFLAPLDDLEAADGPAHADGVVGAG